MAALLLCFEVEVVGISGGSMKAIIRSGIMFVFLFVGVQLASMESEAKTVDCQELPQLLQQMKKAQSSIQESLISNHEMMAQSLESYAESLVLSAGKAHRAISENMKNATGSVRARATKAKSIAQRLESNTDELIKTVEKCLK
jgi:translation initiation factor 2B subunit (eIF-2B alpha/beta/delta family)